MTLKRITLVVQNTGPRDKPAAVMIAQQPQQQHWQVSSQEALESLLRRYGVDALVDPEYACQVTTYAALQENVPYMLGETADTVELCTVINKEKDTCIAM